MKEYKAYFRLFLEEMKPNVGIQILSIIGILILSIVIGMIIGLIIGQVYNFLQ